ncbi:MAG: transglutaminase domain-containing protein [Bacteroidales bacterium]|nr:transglutaminase domain-containing protein [Bacteroidales bacterium]MBP3269832.1 transglutaminase domain-containing protein [Bacteroidales bacterium]
MRKSLLILLSLLVLSSCDVHHLISDPDYRQQMEKDLQARLDGPGDLGQFYQVDDLIITTEEKEALQFLYAYMPLADFTDYTTEYYMANVRSSLDTRDEMGWNVPEREFRHFVLPIRVNNEDLDSSRVVFAREIKPRIQGMAMKDAILEVNHWCHEKLTYKPSDARTLSPLSSMRSSLGRCGEESTFTVAALRSVGIPARQVYTPRWAHSDDNHAWVEAWADGEWYFMGACEPEAVLNLGWFNAPASRGLLMHTRVFGHYDGPEEKVMEGLNFTEINLIDNYAKTARVDFIVKDESGTPVDSALVDFDIYNYAEFYPALAKYTDKDGKTFLTAGKGDMLAWASKDGKYGYSKVSFGKDSLVTVVITKDHPNETTSMMIVPPPEGANIPEVTLEQRKANGERTAKEDQIRKAYMATFAKDDGTPEGKFLAKAAGNHNVIEGFLADHPDQRALDLLGSLSDKDMVDITREILEDSYQSEGSILCPRVANEFLTPYKGFFKGALCDEEQARLSDPANLVKWVKDNITLVNDTKSWRITMSPIGVFKSKLADKNSREIFFVSLARTLGIDARKDPVTGKVQYAAPRQGQDGAKSGTSWIDVDFESAAQTLTPTGTVVLNYAPTGTLANPGYYSNFTISKIENGRTKLLTFDEGQVDMGGGVSWENVFKKGTALDVGEYVLVSGNRLSDGSVPVTLKKFSIEEGQTTTIDLVIAIPSDKLSVIGEFDSETRYWKTAGSDPVSILSTTGRGVYVVGFLTARHEPSVHAVNDLIAAKEGLEKWGRPIMLLTSEEGLDWLKEYSSRMPSNVQFGIAPKELMEGTMPRVMIADTFNRVFFKTEGYTIGLGDQLLGAIAKL